MKLEGILSDKKAAVAMQPRLFTISGAIAPDADASKFRLYPNPDNKRMYLLVNREDVVGEVQEWSPEEMANSGVVGVRLYKLWIEMGSLVELIQVEVHRFAETIAADGFAIGGPGTKAQVRPLCQATSGCGTKPCCTAIPGKADGPCYCSVCCIGRTRQ
jgi:hypothetical protein